MNLPFSLRDRRTVAVTIDMHRGHLDQQVATMPVTPEDGEQLLAAHKVLLDGVRAQGVPVVHVMTSYRSVEEIAQNRWWSAVAGTTATRARVLEHQLETGPGVEIMPEIVAPGDLTVTVKKRYDCFFGTDLDHALRALGAEALLLTGINTNSCVLATTVAANIRDYAAIVVRDCVGTMDKRLHDPALDIIDGAFGWTLTTAAVLDSLAGREVTVGGGQS